MASNAPPEQEGTMTKNRIIGAIAALSLLAVPAVAAAHGSGDDHGHHKGRHHHKHHGKQARDVTGAATGTIASFTDGALTITLPSGRSFTADVTKRTVLLCKSAPATATAAGHGHDNSGPGHGGDDHASSTAPASTTTPSTTVPPPTTGHDRNDDHKNGHGVRCGTDALVAGAKVTDAKLSLKGGDAIWKKVVLVK
jgi:hypothetical protein